MPTTTSPTLTAKIERLRRAAAEREGNAPPVQQLPPPPRRGDEWEPDDPRVTRRWELTAYTKQADEKGKRVEVVLRTIMCVGDRALDEAIAVLEADRDCTRYGARLA